MNLYTFKNFDLQSLTQQKDTERYNIANTMKSCFMFVIK